MFLFALIRQDDRVHMKFQRIEILQWSLTLYAKAELCSLLNIESDCIIYWLIVWFRKQLNNTYQRTQIIYYNSLQIFEEKALISKEK